MHGHAFFIFTSCFTVAQYTLLAKTRINVMISLVDVNLCRRLHKFWFSLFVSGIPQDRSLRFKIISSHPILHIWWGISRLPLIVQFIKIMIIGQRSYIMHFIFLAWAGFQLIGQSRTSVMLNTIWPTCCANLFISGFRWRSKFVRYSEMDTPAGRSVTDELWIRFSTIFPLLALPEIF